MTSFPRPRPARTTRLRASGVPRASAWSAGPGWRRRAGEPWTGRPPRQAHANTPVIPPLIPPAGTVLNYHDGMGARGPLPKPAGRAQGHRTRPATQLHPPDSDQDTPAPPSGLSAAGTAAWAAFWSSPLATIVAATDRPALERLFRARDELDRAWRAFKRQRTVTGSQGQQVLAPEARLMAQLEKEIVTLEDRFGCTPAARARLGLVLAPPKPQPQTQLNTWIAEGAERRERIMARMRGADDRHDDRHIDELRQSLRPTAAGDLRERIRAIDDDAS
jgi:P27 family predicted phage terminase small subunit